MTIEECYSIMGGDWEGIMRRLGNEELIAKLSLKFLSSKEYFDIGDAIRNHDWEKAFMCTHTLKGVAGNLGLTALYGALSALTEPLRRGQTKDLVSLRQAVQAERESLVRLLNG